MRLRYLPLLAVLLVLTSCDSGVTGSDSIFLTAELSANSENTPIRFSFGAGDVTTGRLTDVTCDCELDVEAFLQSRGFSKADIISANLASARLVMLFPISERLDFLDEAILKLEAPGNSGTEVARQSVFPESREVQMEPLTGRDVAGFMDDTAFQPILQIDASSLQANQEYEIGLVVEIRLELAGL